VNASLLRLVSMLALAVLLAGLAVLALPSEASAQEDGISGDLPVGGGVGLVVWGGGPLTELEAAAGARGCALESVWFSIGGRLVGHVFGAPEFVNAEFSAEAGADLAPASALLAVCARPAPSGVRGIALAGPQCPVIVEGEPCPDKPVDVTLLFEQGGLTVATVQTGDDGEFEVRLPPGAYTITKAGGPFPHLVPQLWPCSGVRSRRSCCCSTPASADPSTSPQCALLPGRQEALEHPAHEIRARDDAEDAAVGAGDGERRDAVVEHDRRRFLHQGLRADGDEAVGRDLEDAALERLLVASLRRDAVRVGAHRPQDVAVGEDADDAAAVFDEEVVDAVLLEHGTRLAHRAAGIDGEEVRVHDLAHEDAVQDVLGCMCVCDAFEHGLLPPA
jgi:hypothetical protein